MIKFVIKGKKNPQKKTETKYYAQAAPATPITLEEIVELIEKRCTVASPDGRYLGTRLDLLGKGIYIVGGRKVMR